MDPVHVVQKNHRPVWSNHLLEAPECRPIEYFPSIPVRAPQRRRKRRRRRCEGRGGGTHSPPSVQNGQTRGRRGGGAGVDGRAPPGIIGEAWGAVPVPCPLTAAVTGHRKHLRATTGSTLSLPPPWKTLRLVACLNWGPARRSAGADRLGVRCGGPLVTWRFFLPPNMTTDVDGRAADARREDFPCVLFKQDGRDKILARIHPGGGGIRWAHRGPC